MASDNDLGKRGIQAPNVRDWYVTGSPFPSNSCKPNHATVIIGASTFRSGASVPEAAGAGSGFGSCGRGRNLLRTMRVVGADRRWRECGKMPKLRARPTAPIQSQAIRRRESNECSGLSAKSSGRSEIARRSCGFVFCRARPGASLQRTNRTRDALLGVVCRWDSSLCSSWRYRMAVWYIRSVQLRGEVQSRRMSH